ncbi:DUF4212 domain-containing protein [Halorubraceae archaeon YAN]|nr:DUF4212 domain-containing protein [Halorubraceae archaeon YAN]
MSKISSENQTEEQGPIETAGGTKETADYLDTEINIFKPQTPFMRDHLKIVWASFIVWVVFVFGPVTATVLAPDVMTGTTVLGGYPLHYFLTALIAPFGALVLSAAYAYQRDRLDTKYGITHESQSTDPGTGVAADGGEE